MLNCETLKEVMLPCFFSVYQSQKGQAGLPSLRITGKETEAQLVKFLPHGAHRARLELRPLTPHFLFCLQRIYLFGVTEAYQFFYRQWNFKHFIHWMDWSPLLSCLFTSEMSECGPQASHIVLTWQLVGWKCKLSSPTPGPPSFSRASNVQILSATNHSVVSNSSSQFT